MESRVTVSDLAMIDAADRIARAAYLWLRQPVVQCGQDCLTNGERRAHWFVAGFIFSLCDALQVTRQHGLLAAYAYSLLDGGAANSMEIAAILAEAQAAPPDSGVFVEGRRMADEMFGLLGNSGTFGARTDRYSC